jgi:hypothetical protein
MCFHVVALGNWTAKSRRSPAADASTANRRQEHAEGVAEEEARAEGTVEMGKPSMRAPSNPKRPTPKVTPGVPKNHLQREEQKWRQKQRARPEKKN